jgi:hypothetical protein
MYYRAPRGMAFCSHDATMLIGDSLNDRQPEARASPPSRKERLKNAGEIPRPEPGTAVAYGVLNFVRIGGRCDCYTISPR